MSVFAYNWPEIEQKRLRIQNLSFQKEADDYFPYLHTPCNQSYEWMRHTISQRNRLLIRYSIRRPFWVIFCLKSAWRDTKVSIFEHDIWNAFRVSNIRKGVFPASRRRHKTRLVAHQDREPVSRAARVGRFSILVGWRAAFNTRVAEHPNVTHLLKCMQSQNTFIITVLSYVRNDTTTPKTGLLQNTEVHVP